MKFWGYFSLSVFFVAFIASLATFALVKRPPETGDLITSLLIVFTFVALVAALLSTFVGFGLPAIPPEQRGLRPAVGAMSLPLKIALILGVVYTGTVLWATHYNHVKKILNTYYLELPLEEGETPKRIYVSEGGAMTTRRQISEEEAFSYMWQWTRIYTAVSAAICIVCASFFLSRAVRQSSELKELLAQGMLSSQVDDSMNL